MLDQRLHTLRAVPHLQQNQPPDVPPLELTGERTLPDVPEENYWYRRHVAVYEWIAERCAGLRVADLACGEGYGSDLLAGRATEVIGVDANPEAFEHARIRYRRSNLRFQRGLVEEFSEPQDASELCERPLEVGNVVQDRVTEDEVEAFVVEGELFGVGGHRLHCDPQLVSRRTQGRQHPRRDVCCRGALDDPELEQIQGEVARACSDLQRVAEGALAGPTQRLAQLSEHLLLPNGPEVDSPLAVV